METGVKNFKFLVGFTKKFHIVSSLLSSAASIYYKKKVNMLYTLFNFIVRKHIV